MSSPLRDDYSGAFDPGVGLESFSRQTLAHLGREYLLLGHQVPLDAQSTGGWGRVEIPADENLLDNTAYFVFADPPVHYTTIVSDDERVAETLRIAATAPLDPAISYAAELPGTL